MDKASLIGSILMFVACFVVFWMATHGNLLALWSSKGAIMVIGGTIAVILMAMPMEKITCAMGYVKAYYIHKGKSPAEIIKVMGDLADKARREGILSLEGEVGRLDDPFLQSGMKMAIDGVAPESIEATLRMEVMAMQERHKAGKKFFDLIKVQMLATAVVATMYGTVMANCIAGPMGDKLAMRSAEEILVREMVLQGILSIQGGDNPRVTMDRMLAFVPAVSRALYQKAA